MPRAKVDPYWRQRAYIETANRPKMSHGELAAILEAEARELGRNDFPSPRSVARMQAEYRGFSEAARAQYRYAFFPESFQTGALPWESAGVVAALTSWKLTSQHRERQKHADRAREGAPVLADKIREQPYERPTVRVARAVWELSQVVAPGTPMDTLDWLAPWLAFADELPADRAATLRREVEAVALDLPPLNKGPWQELRLAPLHPRIAEEGEAE